MELNNSNNTKNILTLFKHAKKFNELQKPIYSSIPTNITTFTVTPPEDP